MYELDNRVRLYATAQVCKYHYFVSMYELDGQSYTFLIRLYATAQVCK